MHCYLLSARQFVASSLTSACELLRVRNQLFVNVLSIRQQVFDKCCPFMLTCSLFISLLPLRWTISANCCQPIVDYLSIRCPLLDTCWSVVFQPLLITSWLSLRCYFVVSCLLLVVNSFVILCQIVANSSTTVWYFCKFMNNCSLFVNSLPVLRYSLLFVVRSLSIGWLQFVAISSTSHCQLVWIHSKLIIVCQFVASSSTCVCL